MTVVPVSTEKDGDVPSSPIIPEYTSGARKGGKMPEDDPMMRTLKPTVWMGTKCEMMVDTGRSVAYHCSLRQGHEATGEPHYTIESARAVRAWQQWAYANLTMPTEQVQEVTQSTPALVQVGAEFTQDSWSIKAGAAIEDVAREYSSRHLCHQVKTIGEAVMVCTLPQDHVEAHDFVSPSRADREGDSQPLPTLNDSEDIQTQVIRALDRIKSDIASRRELGISRYGTALQASNGRDAIQDAYDEGIDQLVYLAQYMHERDVLGMHDGPWAGN